MPDMENVIKALKHCKDNQHVNDCNKCDYGGKSGVFCIRMIDDAITLLKEQEDGYKNILSDYEDLAREHEKLLDKKIPLITNGQEVVRCKDCIHWEKGYSEECGNSDSVCFHNGRCQPDWFCADGERR